MASITKTFSVGTGIQVANTIVIDSSLSISNITTLNVTTVNANTFSTGAGSPVPGTDLFTLANTANNTGVNAYVRANLAYTAANSAQTAANTANTNALNAYGQANLAYTAANSAQTYANSLSTSVNSTFATINTNYQAAYAQANSDYMPAVTKLSVTNSGSSAYLFDQYSGNNPTIYIRSAETIAFDLNFAGHPFAIRVSNGGANYNTGLTHVATDGTVTTESSAQGKVSGTLYWKIPSELLGNTYVYQCTNHSGMVGNIVIEPPGTYAYDQANSAYSQANGAYSSANSSANTVRVSQNSASMLAAKSLNFINTASILVTVASSGDGTNANISFTTSGASVADAYGAANLAYTAANSAQTYANSLSTSVNSTFSTINTSLGTANTTFGTVNSTFSTINSTFSTTNSSITAVDTIAKDAYARANTDSTFANGTIVVARSNVNFNNTATISVIAAANGSTQSNISFALIPAGVTTLGSPTNTLTLDANVTINKDMTITGNLFVSGDSTTFNVATLSVEDNEIILNSSNTGAPALDGLITVNRGSSTDVSLKWNETSDKWGWSDDGSTFYNFSSALDAYGVANTAATNALSAYGSANLAYTAANTAQTASNTANTNALNAYGQANAAYTTANTANTTAKNAYAAANTAGGTSQDAFNQANDAYTTANTANTTAKNAYAAANTANTNALNAYGSANLAYTAANSAQTYGNTLSTSVNTTFATINTSLGTANTTFGTVNSTFATINTNYQAAYADANTANTTAKNAYAAANNRVLKAGDTMTGQLTITTSGLGLSVANANVTTSLAVNSLNVFTNTTVTSSSGSNIIDAFTSASMNSVKFFIQANSGVSLHTTEVIVVQDQTNVYATEYGTIHTAASLGTFSADIDSGLVRLLFNATNNVNTVKVVRYGIM